MESSSMKPQSAKNKGRKLQQWIRDLILQFFHELEEDDVQSRSMGAGGEDIILSPIARGKLPYAIEAKNQERVNIWSAYDQAEENSRGFIPAVVIKRNGHKPLVVMSAEDWISRENWLQGS